MKIGIGSTRIVLVFSSFVIKLPRIRLFRMFTRCLELKKKGILIQKSKLYSKKNIFFAIVGYLLEGIKANRLEYSYFKRNRQKEELLPVNLLCFGIIEIQEKGTVLEETSFLWEKILFLLKRKGLSHITSFTANNFCIANKKLKILDYADEKTIEALENGGFAIITDLNKRFG